MELMAHNKILNCKPKGPKSVPIGVKIRGCSMNFLHFNILNGYSHF
jgi:hypothetical protein